MSDEIKEKIQILEQRHHFMTDTWEKRKVLYDQNLDTQVLIIYNIIFRAVFRYDRRLRRVKIKISCPNNYCDEH